MTGEPTAASARAARAVGLAGDRMAAWRGFIEAHARVLTHLSNELQAEQSLPLTWYDVLVQLSEADGQRLRMHELAERVLLSQSGLTRLVDRLEAEGLVQRVRCSDDGRGLFAQLTPEGLDALRRTYPTHLRGVREWFSDLLTDEETLVIARALTRIALNARPPAGSAETDRAGGD
jgi:DNA-binding MarR family transcriptional regulator